MTRLSRNPAGQPVETRPDARDIPADKWAVLDALTHAAPEFGLNHRSLGVLRALLSFFPQRDLPARPGAAIVYPSNRVLSDRLGGMPESTLRRHLAALVAAGIVDRHDSANRKRFARFGQVAFGFDLSPLARAAVAVFAAADRAVVQQHKTAALRARIAAARQRLIDSIPAPDDTLLETARLCLRRKLDPDTLEDIAQQLENALTFDHPPMEMSGSDSRNERHIQTTDESESVFTNPEEADLSSVLDACTEYKSFFPATRPTWTDLHSVAERVHGLMGISPGVFHESRSRLGERTSTTLVLCLLERMDQIRTPGAYLRALTRRGECGKLNLAGLIAAAKAHRVEIVS